MTANLIIKTMSVLPNKKPGEPPRGDPPGTITLLLTTKLTVIQFIAKGVPELTLAANVMNLHFASWQIIFTFA